jgi:hypothetical protein
VYVEGATDWKQRGSLHRLCFLKFHCHSGHSQSPKTECFPPQNKKFDWSFRVRSWGSLCAECIALDWKRAVGLERSHPLL